jgi:hypothetical protein
MTNPWQKLAIFRLIDPNPLEVFPNVVPASLLMTIPRAWITSVAGAGPTHINELILSTVIFAALESCISLVSRGVTRDTIFRFCSLLWPI